jgi:hypothetical protein
MTEQSLDRSELADRIDPELLMMLGRMSKRQQRQVLLLLMVVENLLFEMMRDRRPRDNGE